MLAQLVERGSYEPKVASSSLAQSIVPMAKWIRRLSTEQESRGSNPCGDWGGNKTYFYVAKRRYDLVG